MKVSIYQLSVLMVLLSIASISAVTMQNNTNYYDSISGYNLTTTCQSTADLIDVNNNGNIYLYNLTGCIKNTGASNAKFIMNGTQAIFVNSTGGLSNGSNSNINLNNNSIITLVPNEITYAYNNAVNFQVNYTYSFNQNDQNGYSGGTMFILTGLMGMIGNFFGLSPVIGTILAVCILLAGIVILVLYVRKLSLNNNVNTFRG